MAQESPTNEEIDAIRAEAGFAGLRKLIDACEKAGGLDGVMQEVERLFGRLGPRGHIWLAHEFIGAVESLASAELEERSEGRPAAWIVPGGKVTYRRREAAGDEQ